MINERKDFLFGASSSAFQIEGANKEAGKGLSTVDTRVVKEGIADTSVASDFYHRWEEDLALLKELGVKSFRFSISWPRIYPEGEGKLNQEGLDFYEKIIDRLLEYGIEPLVTVYHFDLPQNLVDKYNGWLGRETIYAYENYAKTLFEYFGEKVKYWISINEPLMVMYSKDFNGIRKLNDAAYQKANYQMMYHMALAEKLAFKWCHHLVPGGKIGPASAFQNIYPASASAKDVEAAMTAEELLSFTLLDLSVRGSIPNRIQKMLKDQDMYPETEEEDAGLLHSESADWICFNYYASLCAEEYRGKDDSSMPPFFRSKFYRIVSNPMGNQSEWMIFGTDSVGLRLSIYKLWQRYNLPLMITENGYANSDELEETGEIHDQDRITYLQEHLEQCFQAIDEGIPLLGYSPWSFLDSLSGREGFAKRYGFVYVNRTDQDLKDLKRYKKDSFYWYQQLIQESER
ncbi:glycoside hydrolase family 1 protein [Carnobacterium mobile]|uniref:glycoside hydrolase family 1 protein n=1 Tax=Carnobacterium mobile TaxID=2750 RepID=UPI0005500127|nr:glycoside hydrolase family 1 protein [Carnobacterium mobile]